jgi:hypothetical protein
MAGSTRAPALRRRRRFEFGVLVLKAAAASSRQLRRIEAGFVVSKSGLPCLTRHRCAWDGVVVADAAAVSSRPGSLSPRRVRCFEVGVAASDVATPFSRQRRRRGGGVVEAGTWS